MVSSARLNARFVTLRETSEADGDEVEVEVARRGGVRYLRLVIGVPGYHRGRLATFEYEEKFSRSARGWRLFGYQYELRFDPAPSGRWAEHWHDDDFHRHCEPASGPHADHYPSRPIQLFDARDELLRRYALGRDALTCSDGDPGQARAR